MIDLLRQFLGRMVEHPHYKVLAVLLALSTWLYVQGEEVGERRVRAAVTYLLPPTLAAVEPPPDGVLVTLTGSLNALRRADTSKLAIEVDLREAELAPGVVDVDLARYALANLNPSLAVVETAPETLRFEVDELVTRRIEVEVDTVGEPRATYAVARVQVEPPTVELSGPRKVLAALEQVATEPVDVTDLRHDKRFAAPVLPPPGVTVLGEPTVEARVDIEPLVERRRVQRVPVLVRGHLDWTVEPSTVDVRLVGPAAALRSIGDKDLVVWVDVDDDAPAGVVEGTWGRPGPARPTVLVPSDQVSVAGIEPGTIRVNGERK